MLNILYVDTLLEGSIYSQTPRSGGWLIDEPECVSTRDLSLYKPECASTRVYTEIDLRAACLRIIDEGEIFQRVIQ